jgi:hypothetical protein
MLPAAQLAHAASGMEPEIIAAIVASVIGLIGLFASVVISGFQGRRITRMSASLQRERELALSLVSLVLTPRMVALACVWEALQNVKNAIDNLRHSGTDNANLAYSRAVDDYRSNYAKHAVELPEPMANCCHDLKKALTELEQVIHNRTATEAMVARCRSDVDVVQNTLGSARRALVGTLERHFGELMLSRT